VISKKLILPMAAVALVGASTFGIVTANAASSPNQSLVQDIANTFHLDPSKVQAVFNQHSAQVQATAETRYQDRLQTAVTKGKLTQSQMNEILAEHAALLGQLASARSQTGAARRQAVEKVRQDAKSWAEQNDLPVSWLLGPRSLRAGSGVMPSPSPSPTP
jgi:hypothetical protein